MGMYNIPITGDTLAHTPIDEGDGQINFNPALATARTSVPTGGVPDVAFSFGPTWDDGDGVGVVDHDDDHGGRQDLPDPNLVGDQPDPGGGYGGTPLPFESVAPYHNTNHTYRHDGHGGSGHGGFVLGPDRPD